MLAISAFGEELRRGGDKVRLPLLVVVWSRFPAQAGVRIVNSSLYDRLGGADAIAAVVDDFVARCAGDGRINKKFARTDIPRLKKMLVDQVAEAKIGRAHV